MMGAGTITEMKELECITLFVEDLAGSKRFYLEIFDLKIVYEDPVSVIFKLESVMINLLRISEAPGLIVPAKVADSSAGQRLMFTVRVPNVDEVCGKLKTLGVQLLNGPQDRPWGRRTAAFADPAGHVWELAHEI
jgi:catechol 2,3-dioxygenase-like lactoylglutathione lyase family enzyme